MGIGRKPETDRIKSIIKELPSRCRLDDSRRWWPQFAFHFTHIENAVGILRDGIIYSRYQMRESGKQFFDGASPQKINETRQEDQRKVRLYFRPRTPTQFRNEGIRTPDAMKLEAHMPVPVFLLFDSADILTRADCQYSNQSVARQFFDQGDTATFFDQLPFKNIYHDDLILENKAEIVGARNAEILIPRQLDLSSLKEIHCRSRAEKDTLLSLIPSDIKAKWRNRVYSDGRRNLFFKWWTYVDSVSLQKDKVSVSFSPETRSPGPFTALIEKEDFVKGETSRTVINGFMANRSYTWKIPPSDYYRFTFRLNDCLAYSNIFEDYDIPF